MGLQGKPDALQHPDDYGLPQAIERAQRFSEVGADFVALTGAPWQWLTKSVVNSVGAPVMRSGEIGHMSLEDWATLEESGVKLVLHALLPKIAAFMAFREALEDFRSHRPNRHSASQ